LSFIEPFVTVKSLVYAKFNGNTKSFFPAKVTTVNIPEPKTGSTEHGALPKVTLDLLFTDDNEVRKACPLSQVYRPLREGIPSETKKSTRSLGKKRSAVPSRGTKRKRSVA
jgi:hypothetical protein